MPAENEVTGVDRIVTCVYCGHEYPPGSPSWGSLVLTEHIKTCEKHPMRAVELERETLRAALRSIIEIWAGADAVQPVSAQEAYVIRLCKQMYEVALKGCVPA